MALVAQIPVPRSNTTISVPTGLFINNEFVPSEDPSKSITSVLFSLYHLPISSISF